MFRKMIMALGAIVMPLTVFAQRPVYFAIKTSFDVTHPAGCNDGINNGSGLTVLGVFNVPLNRNVFIEPGVGMFYTAMGIRPFESGGVLYDGSVRNFGVRIPLSVGYRCGLFENFELAAFTGPVFNVNCSTKAHLEADTYPPYVEASANMFDYGWKHFDAQWGIGLSATYADRYYIAVSGGIGMSPMATFHNADGKHRLRRNTMSITLGYCF